MWEESCLNREKKMDLRGVFFFKERKTKLRLVLLLVHVPARHLLCSMCFQSVSTDNPIEHLSSKNDTKSNRGQTMASPASRFFLQHGSKDNLKRDERKKGKKWVQWKHVRIKTSECKLDHEPTLITIFSWKNDIMRKKERKKKHQHRNDVNEMYISDPRNCGQQKSVIIIMTDAKN